MAPSRSIFPRRSGWHKSLWSWCHWQSSLGTQTPFSSTLLFNPSFIHLFAAMAYSSMFPLSLYYQVWRVWCRNTTTWQQSLFCVTLLSCWHVSFKLSSPVKRFCLSFLENFVSFLWNFFSFWSWFPWVSVKTMITGLQYYTISSIFLVIQLLKNKKCQFQKQYLQLRFFFGVGGFLSFSRFWLSVFLPNRWDCWPWVLSNVQKKPVVY